MCNNTPKLLESFGFGNLYPKSLKRYVMREDFTVYLATKQ